MGLHALPLQLRDDLRRHLIVAAGARVISTDRSTGASRRSQSKAACRPTGAAKGGDRCRCSFRGPLFVATDLFEWQRALIVASAKGVVAAGNVVGADFGSPSGSHLAHPPRCSPVFRLRSGRWSGLFRSTPPDSRNLTWRSQRVVHPQPAGLQQHRRGPKHREGPPKQPCREDGHAGTHLHYRGRGAPGWPGGLPGRVHRR